MVEWHVYRLAPCVLINLLLYLPQDHLPGSGTTHGGLDPHTHTHTHISIVNQENSVTLLPTGQSEGDILSTEVTPVCIKVAKIIQYS